MAITQLPSASAGGCSITRDSALATSMIFLLAKAQNIHPTSTPGLKAGAIMNFYIYSTDICNPVLTTTLGFLPEIFIRF